MVPSAARVGEDAFAPGLLKAGVLLTLKTSHRNCRLSRSVILKLRKRLASRLMTPGPRRILRPVLPKRTPVTGANAVGSNQLTPFPIRPGFATVGFTWSAVCVLPGEFTDVPTAVTLNGVPLIEVKMPFICHPPASQFATPSV